MNSTIEGKPDITYPCQWTFKIIGTRSDIIRRLTEECLKGKKYSLSASNKSSSGKYVSMSLKTEVKDESSRDLIYTYFKGQPDIKMVL